MGATGTTKKVTLTNGQSVVAVSVGAGNEEEQAQEKQEQENELVKTPSEGLDGVTTFEGSTDSATDKWFANPKLSNYVAWEQGLTSDERSGIKFYTGNGYTNLNDQLYNKPWEKMDGYYKEKATALYNAINKFELNKSIMTSRGTNLSYFGGAQNADDLRQFLSGTDGVVQFNGFQSTTTGPKPAFSGNLIIHYTIPPSKGAGAYVRPISLHPNEGEFTVNNNAVVKFDLDSIKKTGYTTHINAVWLGQAADQHFKKKGK